MSKPALRSDELSSSLGCLALMIGSQSAHKWETSELKQAHLKWNVKWQIYNDSQDKETTKMLVYSLLSWLSKAYIMVNF